MNKRGIALLLGLMVVLILSILFDAFFSRSISEHNLVRRYVSSTQAFWSAEEGAAEAIAQLSNEISLGNSSFRYQTTTQNVYSDANSTIYKITSIGRAIDTPIDRKIETYVRYSPYQTPTDFNYAIEVNGPLTLHGSYDILPNDQLDEYYCKEEAGISFASRFGFSSEELKNLAISQGHYYEDPASPLPNFPEPSEPRQITWIKITDPDDQLKIPSSGWWGSGILVVEGETDIEGGTFDGILWVIGKLTITGSPTLSGTVISECQVDVTTRIAGNPKLEWNSTKISNVLEDLLDPFADRTPLSWREAQ